MKAYIYLSICVSTVDLFNNILNLYTKYYYVSISSYMYLLFICSIIYRICIQHVSNLSIFTLYQSVYLFHNLKLHTTYYYISIYFFLYIYLFSICSIMNRICIQHVNNLSISTYPYQPVHLFHNLLNLYTVACGIYN